MEEIGIIGLGKMGMGMSRRFLKHNVRVVGFNRSKDKVSELIRNKGIGAFSIDELVSKLKTKRKIIWLMLPTGKPTEEMIKLLLKKLNGGDIIIDGANGFYKDAEKNAKLCNSKGIIFFDIGVSSGIYGENKGYSLMIGGPKQYFKEIEPLCKLLAPEKGYGYFGENGSGHYVKSVHNIIEYVYLEGIAEGVELLDKKKIDLIKATEVWKNGSVIDSFLMDLTNKALKRKDFNKISSQIGSVTINELVETVRDSKGFSPAFNSSVKVRKDKSSKFLLGKKTIAAVRNEFGGHEVKK